MKDEENSPCENELDARVRTENRLALAFNILGNGLPFAENGTLLNTEDLLNWLNHESFNILIHIEEFRLSNIKADSARQETTASRRIEMLDCNA